MKELQGTPPQSHTENHYSVKTSTRRKEERDVIGTLLLHSFALFSESGKD